MPVAAGFLGERTEQAILTQTTTARTGGVQHRATRKGTEEGTFHRLFSDLTDEKEKTKEEPAGNADLWSQLMFLSPELSPLPPAQTVETAGEVELLFAGQEGGGSLPPRVALRPEVPVLAGGDFAGTAETMEAMPKDATLAITVTTNTGSVAQTSSEETAEHNGGSDLTGQTEPQSASFVMADRVREEAFSTEQEAVVATAEETPSPSKSSAVEAPARSLEPIDATGEPLPELHPAEGKEPQTGPDTAAVMTAATTVETTEKRGKTAATEAGNDVSLRQRTEPALTKTNRAIAVIEATKPVHTVEDADIVETGERAGTTEIKPASTAARTGISQGAVAATGTEPFEKNLGGTGAVEPDATVRERVFPADGADQDAFTAVLDTVEREPKTRFKVETAADKEAQFPKGLRSQTFSPVAGESPIREPQPEATAVQSEPVAPQRAREELAAQIVNGARFMIKDGVTKIQLQLEPAELGKLELSLVVERDLVAARFVTETHSVQSLIEASLPELRTALEEAGLQVDLLQVGVQTGTDSQLLNQNMTGGEEFKRNAGWQPAAERYLVEEPILAEEAWDGMVNLRI